MLPDLVQTLANGPVTPAAQNAARVQFAIWVSIVGVVIVALLAFLLWLRKRLLAREPGRDAAASIVEEMRRLKAEGKISAEEYQRARERWIRSVKASSASSGRTKDERRGKSPGAKTEGSAGSIGRPPGSEGPAQLQARPGFDLTGERLPEKRVE